MLLLNTNCSLSGKQRRSKFQRWVTRIVNEARVCLFQPQPRREQMVGVMNNLKAMYEKYKAVSEHLIELLVEDGEVNADVMSAVELPLFVLTYWRSLATSHSETVQTRTYDE